MEENNLEYLSEEAKEILHSRPSWVTNWALAGIVSVLLLLAFAGAIFSYSEIVVGEFILTTEEPPVPIQVPKTGYLDKLFIAENSNVSPGQMLAVFASDEGAVLEDVLSLETQIENMENANMDSLRNFRASQNLQLGELAGDYENFVSVLQHIPIEGISPADQGSIFALRQTIGQLQRSINSIEIDNQAKQNELTALQREFNNANEMYKKTLDESYSSVILQYNSKISEKKAEITANNAKIQLNLDQIQENNVRIAQIESQSSSGLENKFFQLRQSVISLKNEIRRWKSLHLVTAPTSGRVSFYKDLTVNQLLRKDDVMLAIIPESAENKFIGYASIPVKGSGRVEEGQPVKIKFLRYPHQEFGVVQGKVKKIYPLPNDNAYSVEVELVNGLETSKGQPLEFHQQMAGQAEIVTNEKLFIKKLFEKFL